MAVGDITSYLEPGNKYVNVEDSTGNKKKAVLIADSGSIKDTRIVENQAPGIENFLSEELNDISIVSVSGDGKVITLGAGHNFINPVYPDMDFMNLHYVDSALPGFLGTRFDQLAVIGVAGNDIQVTPPISYVPDTSKYTSQKRVNVNMAVAATRGAPIEFITYPPGDQTWQIRRYIGDMILTTAGDDGLFGNIAVLLNGEYFGFENISFVQYALPIFDNGDFRATGYDVEYIPRSGGGGTHGMSFRKTLAGQDKSGVVLQLEGATNDRFINVKQDDLTGLVRFRIKIMGDIL